MVVKKKNKHTIVLTTNLYTIYYLTKYMYFFSIDDDKIILSTFQMKIFLKIFFHFFIFEGKSSPYLCCINFF